MKSVKLIGGDHRIHSQPILEAVEERYNESNRQVIPVQADTVDSLLRDIENDFTDEIAVVWVDVQGYEGYVFAGAKQLLENGVPVVSEIWPYGIYRSGMSAQIFCRQIEELWLTYWVWNNKRFVNYPIAEFTAYFDLLSKNNGSGNVIFMR